MNGTSIPATGNLNLNGTSLTVLNLNATEVWRKVTDVNVLKAGAYTVSGKNGGSYANTSQMSANSNGGKTDVYNHAICIKVSTGDHTKLQLAGSMKRAQYAMSRVRVGKSDPQLYNNLYGGEGEGPGDEYLEYHSGWNGNRWIESLSFSRTVTVPKKLDHLHLAAGHEHDKRLGQLGHGRAGADKHHTETVRKERTVKNTGRGHCKWPL